MQVNKRSERSYRNSVAVVYIHAPDRFDRDGQPIQLARLVDWPGDAVNSGFFNGYIISNRNG